MPRRGQGRESAWAAARGATSSRVGRSPQAPPPSAPLWQGQPTSFASPGTSRCRRKCCPSLGTMPSCSPPPRGSLQQLSGGKPPSVPLCIPTQQQAQLRRLKTAGPGRRTKSPKGCSGAPNTQMHPLFATLVQQALYPIILQVGSQLQQVTHCDHCLTSPAAGNGLVFYYISRKIWN